MPIKFLVMNGKEQLATFHLDGEDQYGNVQAAKGEITSIAQGLLESEVVANALRNAGVELGHITTHFESVPERTTREDTPTIAGDVPEPRTVPEVDLAAV